MFRIDADRVWRALGADSGIETHRGEQHEGYWGLRLCSAAADTTVSNWHKGRFFKGGNATIGWVTASDSPSDTNSKALQIVVPDSSSFAGLYSNASLNKVLTVQRQRNLSFEFSESNPDAISTRISVQFQNGDIAYLDSHYCNNPIPVSGGTWGRADFTGQLATNGRTCGFYATTGTDFLFYAATAEQSAWAVFAAAHPDEVVTQRYLVADGGGVGTFLFDRVSLGVGDMYTKGNLVAVSCTSEASC